MGERSRRAGWLAAAAVLALSAPPGQAAAGRDCVDATPQWEAMSERAVTIERDDGTRLELAVRVADEWQERAAGFQYICPEVIEDSRVLFVFDAETASRFHMNNVRGALDIGFFAADGTLIDVTLMHPPAPGGTSALYGPSRPFRYALEAAPGFFDANGLEAGAARLETPPGP